MPQLKIFESALAPGLAGPPLQAGIGRSLMPQLKIFELFAASGILRDLNAAQSPLISIMQQLDVLAELANRWTVP